MDTTPPTKQPSSRFVAIDHGQRWSKIRYLDDRADDERRQSEPHKHITLLVSLLTLDNYSQQRAAGNEHH